MYMKYYINDKEYTLIDDKDYDIVKGHKWRILRKNNNIRYVVDMNGRIYLHRLICNAPKGMAVDHINYDTMDNRRSNIRICTIKNNIVNARPSRRKKTSNYKGVYFAKRKQKYMARITQDYKRISLGYYDCEKQAAMIYNWHALRNWGGYAYLNDTRENAAYLLRT